jgi:hypothetical protein
MSEITSVLLSGTFRSKHTSKRIEEDASLLVANDSMDYGNNKCILNWDFGSCLVDSAVFSVIQEI